MKKYLNERLESVLKSLGYFGSAELTFEHPKNPDHGDFTTNIAMMLAKELKKNPRQLASEILNAVDLDRTEFRDPRFPVISNVDGRPVLTGAEAREALKRQVSRPVLIPDRYPPGCTVKINPQREHCVWIPGEWLARVY